MSDNGDLIVETISRKMSPDEAKCLADLREKVITDNADSRPYGMSDDDFITKIWDNLPVSKQFNYIKGCFYEELPDEEFQGSIGYNIEIKFDSSIDLEKGTIKFNHMQLNEMKVGKNYFSYKEISGLNTIILLDKSSEGRFNISTANRIPNGLANAFEQGQLDDNLLKALFDYKLDGNTAEYIHYGRSFFEQKDPSGKSILFQKLIDYMNSGGTQGYSPMVMKGINDWRLSATQIVQLMNGELTNQQAEEIVTKAISAEKNIDGSKCKCEPGDMEKDE